MSSPPCQIRRGERRVSGLVRIPAGLPKWSVETKVRGISRSGRLPSIPVILVLNQNREWIPPFPTKGEFVLFFCDSVSLNVGNRSRKG